MKARPVGAEETNFTGWDDSPFLKNVMFSSFSEHGLKDGAVVSLPLMITLPNTKAFRHRAYFFFFFLEILVKSSRHIIHKTRAKHSVRLIYTTRENKEQRTTTTTEPATQIQCGLVVSQSTVLPTKTSHKKVDTTTSSAAPFPPCTAPHRPCSCVTTERFVAPTPHHPVSRPRRVDDKSRDAKLGRQMDLENDNGSQEKCLQHMPCGEKAKTRIALDEPALIAETDNHHHHRYSQNVSPRFGTDENKAEMNDTPHSTKPQARAPPNPRSRRQENEMSTKNNQPARGD